MATTPIRKSALDFLLSLREVKSWNVSTCKVKNITINALMQRGYVKFVRYKNGDFWELTDSGINELDRLLMFGRQSKKIIDKEVIVSKSTEVKENKEVTSFFTFEGSGKKRYCERTNSFPVKIISSDSSCICEIHSGKINKGKRYRVIIEELVEEKN